MQYIKGNLILKYLTKQCSEDEIEDVDAWLNESTHNRNTFNYFKQMVSSQIFAK